jgi:hypothetical protein
MTGNLYAQLSPIVIKSVQKCLEPKKHLVFRLGADFLPVFGFAQIKSAVVGFCASGFVAFGFNVSF